MNENNNNNKLTPQLIYYYSYNKENSHKTLLLDIQIQSELLKNLIVSLNDYEIFAKKSFKELKHLNFIHLDEINQKIQKMKIIINII